MISIMTTVCVHKCTQRTFAGDNHYADGHDGDYEKMIVFMRTNLCLYG